MNQTKQKINGLQTKPTIPLILPEHHEWRHDKKNRLVNAINRAIDDAMRYLAIIFLIATSLTTVNEWLVTKQSNNTATIAGSIMIVSIALYLTFRKQ